MHKSWQADLQHNLLLIGLVQESLDVGDCGIIEALVHIVPHSKVHPDRTATG